MEAVEQDATKQFLLGLIDNVKSDSERGEIEYMSERIFPVLVPGKTLRKSGATKVTTEDCGSHYTSPGCHA